MTGNRQPVAKVQEVERMSFNQAQALLRNEARRSMLLLLFGRLIFRYRNVIFPIVFVALLVSFRPRGYLSAEWELGSNLVALLVAGLGQALHIAVLGVAPIKRGGLDKRVYADRLLTVGCFAHCRNPLYLGNLLIDTGL